MKGFENDSWSFFCVRILQASIADNLEDGRAKWVLEKGGKRVKLQTRDNNEVIFGAMTLDQMTIAPDQFFPVKEKTCFRNKSKFTTEDYFVQHVNITATRSIIKWNYIQKVMNGPNKLECLSSLA